MRLARWAIIWMVLVALACGSALAKDGDRNRDRDSNRDRNVVFVDCSQVQQVFVTQGQYKDDNAVPVGEGEAVAAVAQDLDISQSQVNACLGNLGGGEETTTGDTTTGDTTTGDTTTGDTTTGDTTTAKTADTDDEGDVIAGTIPEADELPDTGGASGLALAAGCALLGVGLLVNRIFR